MIKKQRENPEYSCFTYRGTGGWHTKDDFGRGGKSPHLFPLGDSKPEMWLLDNWSSEQHATYTAECLVEQMKVRQYIMQPVKGKGVCKKTH